MVDMDKLIQAARIVKDENGEPVVQVPLNLWQDVVGPVKTESIPDKPSQVQQILSLLKEWENDPEHDMPDEWWDEFEQFLQENRMNFPERDLGFGDE